MASLSELVQAAEYISQARGRQQSILPNAMSSFMRGQSGESEAARNQVDIGRAMKMMELRNKLIEQKEKEQNLQVSRNIMIANELLPMDEGSERIGRMSMQELLNEAKGKKERIPKTESAQVINAVNEANKKLLEGKKLDITGTTKANFAYTFTDKQKDADRTPGSASFQSLQNSILAEQRRLATAEERDRIQREGGDINIFDMPGYVPPIDVTLKMRPFAEELIMKGTSADLRKYQGEREEKYRIKNEIEALSKQYPKGSKVMVGGKKAKVVGYSYDKKTKQAKVDFE